MTEFDKLCQEAEDIDWETRCAIVRGKSQFLFSRKSMWREVAEQRFSFSSSSPP